MERLREKIYRHSKGMAAVTKVLCILLVIGLCIPVATVVWYAVSPNTDFFALKSLSFYSATGRSMASSGELMGEMCTIMVSGVFLLYILFLAYRIFESITKEMMPFAEQNVKRFKKIALVLLVYAIIQPISRAVFYRLFAPELALHISLNTVSIILALMFFFLSVVFAYGAELQKLSDETL